ncbi:sensor histidine kinase [Portibacter lacus]|uniref:Histidine kinase n=1 Tax=Portibacter lacus TaxID=1099794 RepID=A0AA37WGZ7_9BACT|nr:sensor histidine kinase [Portibacter lacus]GLR18330.1 histidine kinase [Portibacter lacus]
MSLKTDFKINIPDWAKRDTLFHALFWVGLYVALIIIDQNPTSVFTLIIELVNLVFYMIIVYFNLYFLIPNYLRKNSGINYAIALVLTAIILTPIKTILFYLLFTDQPGVQSYFIAKQGIIFFQMLFYGSISTIFQIILDWQKGSVEKMELHHKNTETELNFLKSQINPHFLFNTLNNLYALTLKKSDQAPEIVLKLSEMMRYMLYECNEERVPLRKEVNYLENYLELEKLRQKKHIKIDFLVSGLIKDQKIAPLMFIPFLENSFKHGLNNQLGEGYVKILLKIMEDEIHFSIDNSKTETAPKPHGKKSGGIGLVNVKRRLDLLYPNSHELNLKESPTNYYIDLKIKLNN